MHRVSEIIAEPKIGYFRDYIVFGHTVDNTKLQDQESWFGLPLSKKEIRIEMSSTSKTELKTRGDVLEYTLEVAELSTGAQSHLHISNIGSITKLIGLSKEVLDEWHLNGDISIADVNDIMNIQGWITAYSAKHSALPTIDDWKNVFNETTWLTYITNVRKSEGAPYSGNKSSTTRSNHEGIATARVSDFPKFNGRNDSWHTFKDKFEGTASAQGFSHVLKKYERTASVFHDTTFIQENRFIYGVLKTVCAEGIAKSHVAKHSSTEDGNAVWNTLKDHYESQGSVEQMTLEVMAELDALQLNYNSYGGFDTYTDNFTTLCLRLEDAKAGLSDIMKKTKFISQIHDRDYGPILSRARTTPEWISRKRSR